MLVVGLLSLFLPYNIPESQPEHYNREVHLSEQKEKSDFEGASKQSR